MFLGATNFILIYHFVRGDFSRPLESDEFRFYVGIVAGSTVLLSLLLFLNPTVRLPAEATLRHAAFQVVSIMTTTGFATVDYNVWSPAAKHLLFALMFLGGMVGSTTCSIKLLRWLVVVKAVRRELYTAVHPDVIRPVRLGGDVIDDGAIQQVYTFTLLSLIVFFLGATFVAVDGHRSGLGLSEFEAMGAAAATFFNVGPAFGIAGPYETYAVFSDATKVAMILLMWIGRIEIIPVLVLLTRSYWTS
jgi:trk system potassium uptake protein TrkH